MESDEEENSSVDGYNGNLRGGTFQKNNNPRISKGKVSSYDN